MADLELLPRVFDQLAGIEKSLGAIAVDVATLKADSKTNSAIAIEVKDQALRLTKLEIAAAGWAGAAGASGAVGKWVAGILAGFIVGGGMAVMGYIVGHK